MNILLTTICFNQMAHVFEMMTRKTLRAYKMQMTIC